MGVQTSKSESLTSEEKKLVTESWSILMKDPVRSGCLILKTFLDKHDLYHKFKKFQNVPRQDIEANEFFRHHAALIMDQINKVILAADDITTLKRELIKLGIDHAKRKIKHKEFQDLKDVIISVLEKHYQLPFGTLNAWRKTLDIGFYYVCEGLRQARAY